MLQEFLGLTTGEVWSYSAFIGAAMAALIYGLIYDEPKYRSSEYDGICPSIGFIIFIGVLLLTFWTEVVGTLIVAIVILVLIAYLANKVKRYKRAQRSIKQGRYK